MQSLWLIFYFYSYQATETFSLLVLWALVVFTTVGNKHAWPYYSLNFIISSELKPCLALVTSWTWCIHEFFYCLYSVFFLFLKISTTANLSGKWCSILQTYSIKGSSNNFPLFFLGSKMSTLNEVNRNEEKGNLYKSLDEADPEMFNLIIKEKDRQMKGTMKSGILKLIMFILSKFLYI